MDILEKLSNMCPVVDKLKIIDDHYSEVSLDLCGSDEFCKNGTAMFECNPFEGQIWNVVNALRYVEEIHEISIQLSQRKYNEDDIITVRW